MTPEQEKRIIESSLYHTLRHELMYVITPDKSPKQLVDAIMPLFYQFIIERLDISDMFNEFYNKMMAQKTIIINNEQKTVID